jgi:hypothetical protein
MKEEELIQLGFRWPRRTSVVLADGRHAIVTPVTYAQSKDNPRSSEYARKAARLYCVTCDNGEAYPDLTEMAVENLLCEIP